MVNGERGRTKIVCFIFYVRKHSHARTRAHTHTHTQTYPIKSLEKNTVFGCVVRVYACVHWAVARSVVWVGSSECNSAKISNKIPLLLPQIFFAIDAEFALNVSVRHSKWMGQTRSMENTRNMKDIQITWNHFNASIVGFSKWYSKPK